MQEYSTTDLTNICQDVAKQRSFFLCVFSSCQARHYGAALASAILSCSDRGSKISPLLPVEIRSEKLAGRQLSPDLSFSDPLPTPDEIQNPVVDHKLTLALECNAGPDGVVTVSLSSPPTFATHISEAPGFPGGRVGPSATDDSSTSTGPTMTQLQGRPPLPSAGGDQLTVSDSNQGGQTGQRGQAGPDSENEIDTDYETTSTHFVKESSTPGTKDCGCAEETRSTPAQSVSACEPTAQRLSMPTTASRTISHIATSALCEKSSEASVASAKQISSPSTSRASSTTKASSMSITSSPSEESSCETPESVTKHTPKAGTTSTPCSEESTYASSMHIPKLPAQKSFSNATSNQPITSTISTTLAIKISSSSSCDTTPTSSTAGSFTSVATPSVTSSSKSPSTPSGASLSTSAASTSPPQATGNSKEADSACSTSLSSRSTKTSTSLAPQSTVSQNDAVSHSSEPPAYTQEDLPQAYETFPPMPLPSYANAAPPAYGARISAQDKPAVPQSNSIPSSSSKSSSSTSISLSASAASSTVEIIPSYGYNFPAASEATRQTSATPTEKSKSSQATSKKEYPDSAASFHSSDPDQEVENTASSEKKSHFPGIETIPLPSKSSAMEPPATTQVLPIGGGPPVLFVTIIEPDADGNLETSVLTVSEQSPWQTPMTRASHETDNTLRARVDGYRMGMVSDVLTQSANTPASTISPVGPSNRTTTLVDATSNATETFADVVETNASSGVPFVSSASIERYCLTFLAFILSSTITWLALS